MHSEWINPSAYLSDAAGPVPLVLDLRISHERWGSSSNSSLYPPPDDILSDRPLNEVLPDKIRDHRTDYNNRPSNSISFIPAVTSTFGHLHCDLVRILFFRLNGKQNAFLLLQEFSLHNPTSSTTVMFYSQLKSKVGNILDKTAALCITDDLNIDVTPIASRSDTHPSHSQTSRLSYPRPYP